MLNLNNPNPESILRELDEFLSRKDHTAAEEFLLETRAKAQNSGNIKIEFLAENELMGLYRKLGRKDDALKIVNTTLDRIATLGIDGQVGVATTYLNCATVFKAFEQPKKALTLYQKAKTVYEEKLNPNDTKLAGLYNNMALALVDLRHFSEADSLYKKALAIMENAENGQLDAAITYLNMASSAEAQLGLEKAESIIAELIDTAEKLLENYPHRDGYYAFVCEKCATVFGYYGYFRFENELKERAKAIYERS